MIGAAVPGSHIPQQTLQDLNSHPFHIWTAGLALLLLFMHLSMCKHYPYIYTHTHTHLWPEEEGHYATGCVEILFLVKTCYGYSDHMNAKKGSNNDLSPVSKSVC